MRAHQYAASMHATSSRTFTPRKVVTFWFLVPLALIALGGVTLTPLTTPLDDVDAIRQGAKVLVALATLLTALLFAYADTTPSADAETDNEKWKRQDRRRDRAKLFTHGAVIGIAVFVFLATAYDGW